MPGIELATDLAAMVRFFSPQMHACSGDNYRIVDLHILSIRHRASQHCILHYELVIVETRTGLHFRTWLCGVIYPDNRPAKRWKKLSHLCAGLPKSRWWRVFGPAFHLPETNMLVQTYPCDRRLPGLSKVLTEAAPEFEAMILGHFGTGDWQILHREVKTVRYRPHSGAVLRYMIEALEASTGRSEKRTFFVKISRDTGGERTGRLLTELQNEAYAAGHPFGFAHPVGYLNNLRALVLEESPGLSLEQIILRGHDVEEAARKVAKGLAAFHQAGLAPASLQTENSVITKARVSADYLCWAFPKLSAIIEIIVHAIEDGLKEITFSPAHNDLKPDHVFIDGERIVFVDLDDYANADPVLDVAALIVRLSAMPCQFKIPKHRMESAASAFMEEYFLRVPNEWRNRLPLNYACAALRMASVFFRQQEPNWLELAPAWIEQAHLAAQGLSVFDGAISLSPKRPDKGRTLRPHTGSGFGLW